MSQWAHVGTSKADIILTGSNRNYPKSHSCMKGTLNSPFPAMARTRIKKGSARAREMVTCRMPDDKFPSQHKAKSFRRYLVFHQITGNPGTCILVASKLIVDTHYSTQSRPQLKEIAKTSKNFKTSQNYKNIVTQRQAPPGLPSTLSDRACARS